MKTSLTLKLALCAFSSAALGILVPTKGTAQSTSNSSSANSYTDAGITTEP